MPIGATGGSSFNALGAVGAGLTAFGGLSNASAVSDSIAAQQAAFSNLISTAQADPTAIFGSIPQYQHVDYTPLYQSDPGYAGLVNDALKGDLHNLPLATDLTSQINKATSADALSRIQGWDPSFLASLNLLQNNANAALQGNLPYSDALQIAGGQGQLSNQLGMAGGQGPQVAADLGLTRSSLMNTTGPSLLGQITSILNQVDPVTNQINASNFLLNPSQAVSSAVQENQFGATFNMNQNLQEAAFGAMPDPAAQGIFNLQAAQAAMAGQYDPSTGMALSSIGSLFQSPYVNGQYPVTSNPYGNLFGTNPYGQPYTGSTQSIYGGLPISQQYHF